MKYVKDSLKEYKRFTLALFALELFIALIMILWDLCDLGKFDILSIFAIVPVIITLFVVVNNPILFNKYNILISQEKIEINKRKQKTEINFKDIIRYQFIPGDKRKTIYRFQVQTTKGSYFFFTSYCDIILKILNGESLDFSKFQPIEETLLDKKKKVFFYIALGITFALAILVFIFADIYYFGFIALFRYGWIFLFSVPFLITALVINLKKRQKEENYSIRIVIPIVLASILSVFGTISSVVCLRNERLLIGNTNIERVNEIESVAQISLPHQVKILTFNRNNTKIESHIHILSKHEKKEFEQNLLNNNQWSTTLSKSVVKKLSINERKVGAMKYYMFYNISDNIYNPEINERIKMDYIFIGYNQIKGSLYIQQEVDAFFTPYY